MSDSFYEALDARYQAIQQSRVGSGAYGTDYKVSDLSSVYGSDRALAEAYAEKYGVKLGSAQKALSRLKRFEAGERGGDVRGGSAQVQERLNELGRERVGNPPSPTPNTSGEPGGFMDVSGTVAIPGGDDGDYIETREIAAWPLTSQQADALAIASHEQGQEAAAALFMDYYNWSGATLYNVSDVTFQGSLI